MERLNIQVDDETLILNNTPLIASGSKNYDAIKFSFDSTWDSFALKTGIFYKNKDTVYSSLLDSDNVCTIPSEVLADEGIMFIGVFGVNDDVTKTTEAIAFKVTRGAINNNAVPSAPNENIYEQIINLLNDIKSEVASFETDINKQQSDFETAMKKLQSTYETNLNKVESNFETKITNQQNTFENTILGYTNGLSVVDGKLCITYEGE